MAINVFFITQVSDVLGFTPWTWIPLLSRETLDTINSIAYAEIPENLVPASEFQVSSETSTCTLIAPWGGFEDPFSEFLRNGGTTGTILGALNGLNIIEQSFLQKGAANYGLGQEYLGPQIGYCIGTLFKEKVYTEVNAINVLNFNPLLATPGAENQFGSSKEQLIWRSKFERFYLNHGTIRAFQEIDRPNGEFTVNIDTKAETSSVGKIDFSNVPDSIKLIKRRDGSSVTFSIDEVRGINGGIEIDVAYDGPPIEISFIGGDYFTLSKSWLIQDPYLLDGVMNSIKTGSLPSGNQEFFRTDQNATISEGSVTGVYIRRRNIAVGDDVVVGGKPGKVIGVSNNTETDETNETDETDLPDGGEFVVKSVDVQFKNEETTEGIPVEEVFLVSESSNNSQLSSSVTQTVNNFVSLTVSQSSGQETVENDPVFQPTDDFQGDLDKYFSPSSDGAVFGSQEVADSEEAVSDPLPDDSQNVIPEEDLD